MVYEGEEGTVVPYVTYAGILLRMGFWTLNECDFFACNRDGSFVNVFETEELKQYLGQLKSFRDQNLTNTYDQKVEEFFAMEWSAYTDQPYESVYEASSPLLPEPPEGHCTSHPL